MAPSASPRLRVLSVGGNAVSAFLSWRLQATNACDVTLVWKSGFEVVSQYGISFKSKQLGNERFKPRSVVRCPEDAACAGGFDYVLLCIKALPDVYDLAAVIESVVTPQHTCILVNTTNSLGIEPFLQTRYPSNVILSLVSGANISQVGPSEFEHLGNSDVWVGSTIKNSEIPTSVQMDMAEALALTLISGNVECHVSANIRQQQWEKMIGPIAFHPLSVLLDSPNHIAMMEKPGIRKLVHDLVEELITIATAEGSKFPDDFKTKILESMVQPSDHQSTMYQDYTSRRPMEIEVYLGSPIKIAQLVGVKAPHCETLYSVLHHINQANQAKSPNSSPPSTATPPSSRQVPPRTQTSVRGKQPSNQGPSPGPSGRRPPAGINGGPHLSNGHGGRVNGGYSPKPPSNGLSRRNSFENDLEEFGHIAMYGDSLEADDGHYLPDGGVGHQSHMGGEHGRQRGHSAEDLALRERELALRKRELELREHELMRRSEGASRVHGRGGPGSGARRHSQIYEDDDDEDDVYYDNGPLPPSVDPDTIDMMSVTSRRNRRVPSAGNLRNMDPSTVPASRGLRHPMASQRPAAIRNRTSARLVSEIPSLHDNILENPLMGYSSNRYGTVDRKMLHDTSRANSLSATRLGDIGDDPAFSNLGQRGGPYPGHGSMPRQGGLPPNTRPSGTPGPGNGYLPDTRGRGPPHGRPPVRQSMPRYLPGPGEQQIPGQVDHHNYDPVSQSHLNKGPPSNKNRSTTGSASASAASGDSGSGVSALLDSENSAYSSSSSLDRKAGYVK